MLTKPGKEISDSGRFKPGIIQSRTSVIADRQPPAERGMRLGKLCRNGSESAFDQITGGDIAGSPLAGGYPGGGTLSAEHMAKLSD